MKVKIEYVDSSGLSDREILSQMATIFGDSVNIETAPSSNTPRACIEYAINKLLTEDQATLYFDYPKRVYDKKLEEKKQEVLDLCSKILNDIIRYNENRWT